MYGIDFNGDLPTNVKVAEFRGRMGIVGLENIWTRTALV